jgi:hypothetical protein
MFRFVPAVACSLMSARGALLVAFVFAAELVIAWLWTSHSGAPPALAIQDSMHTISAQPAASPHLHEGDEHRDAVDPRVADTGSR